MPINQKLSQEDIAFLEVVEDPVWFTEFLRCTNDGDTNEESHKNWKYRDYQKQFLTDTSTYMSLVGGRAIGKCQRGKDRLYVVDEGYVELRELSWRTSVYVYAIDDQLRLCKSKAQVVEDHYEKVLEITTASGNSIGVTPNHPLYTEKGWVEAKDITAGMKVAVTHRLPNESTRSMFMWHELRLLGYLYFIGMKPTARITPRFNKIREELLTIAKILPQKVETFIDSVDVQFCHRVGRYKAPMTTINRQLQKRRFGYFQRLPNLLKQESNERIQIFLEALLAQYAVFTREEIRIPIKLVHPPQDLNGRPLWRSHFHAKDTAKDIQELFLRFGCIGKIYGSLEEDTIELVFDLEHTHNVYTTFTIPGVSIGKLKQPIGIEKINNIFFFDTVVSNTIASRESPVYAVYVQHYHTYLSENFLSHNTVLLEDMKIYEIVNADTEFPDTQESALATANQAQLTPLLNKLILRFTSSKILKDYLKGRVNKADGTMLFETERDKPMTMFFRIAGKTPEQNVVGLHVARIDIDESQLFPPNAFTQLMPAFNHWERNTRIRSAGVPNGLRNSVLYQLDVRDPKYKKYRIPAHNNPFYTKHQNTINLRTLGGEEDDRYQQLVLGRHGNAAFQLLSTDSFQKIGYAFYSYHYSGFDKARAVHYWDVLKTPEVDSDVKILSIDPGYVDPTIIQLIVWNGKHWRTVVRYRLQRINFHEQTIIIDWIAKSYNVSRLTIDVGAGGNGSSIVHNLTNDKEKYDTDWYQGIIKPVQNNENLLMGIDPEGEELYRDTKSVACYTLIELIEQKELVFSELDFEGVSQLERMVKQKTQHGRERFYILSKSGQGAETDDHIFASYVTFAASLQHGIEVTTKVTKLASPDKVTSKLHRLNS